MARRSKSRELPPRFVIRPRISQRKFGKFERKVSIIMKTILAALSVMLLAGVSAFAQQNPGTIATLEFQTPKSGMAKQYEDGRKQKAEWHKQQKDSQPLLVWETITGDHTGTYIVGRLGQHWADLDKPSVPEQSDIDEYNKVVGAYVQSLVTRYYEFLPKISKPPDSHQPPKYSEIITYSLRPGKAEDFRATITRVTEGIEKTKWPVHFEWYTLATGGSNDTYVLVIPHANWADLEDKPDMKPFPEMLKDAFGPAEAESLIKRLDAATEHETNEMIQFRPDLSYLLNK
jgi:hypothetical protein